MAGWMCHSLSSTTSFHLRFNCWPNTRFLLCLHDLYTLSPSPPMHYRRGAHSTYIKPIRREFPLPAKLEGALKQSISTKIYFVSFRSFWCETQSKRQQPRPFLLTSCSLGLASSRSNDVWQRGMTAHTQLIKVMSGLAALLVKQLTNNLEDWTLLLPSLWKTLNNIMQLSRMSILICSVTGLWAPHI